MIDPVNKTLSEITRFNQHTLQQNISSYQLQQHLAKIATIENKQDCILIHTTAINPLDFSKNITLKYQNGILSDDGLGYDLLQQRFTEEFNELSQIQIELILKNYHLQLTSDNIIISNPNIEIEKGVFNLIQGITEIATKEESKKYEK